MKWLIIILWLVLGVFYYTLKNNYTKECCQQSVEHQQPKEQDVTPVVTEERDPLTFKYNDTQAYLTDKFPAYKASILQRLKDGQTIIITGYYGSEETNNTKYENLGIARAEAIKALLLKDNSALTSDRIQTRGALREDAIKKEGYMKCYTFAYKDKETPKKVIKLDDRTLIYFEYGTDRPIQDREVMNYLDRVAEATKNSGQKIYLTGHTDNHSSTSFNYQLGLKRANKIANYLKRKGVPAKQIIVRSKGETAPIAPNSTDEGRQKNRRVELKIK